MKIHRAQVRFPPETPLPRRRFILGAAALAAAASVDPAWAARGTQLNVERRGSEIGVEALAEVDASMAQTWSTLVDYDRFAEFIPDMASSRTLNRNGATALVEQRGRAGFGPFRQSFRLVLSVEETLDESIRAVGLEGDFRHFDAGYALAAIDSTRTRIAYRATIEPNAGVPPLIGVPVMRSMIRRQFEAMLAEIGRRAQLVDGAAA